jgi:uncharacterized protein YjaG (DUF416 family)
MSHQGENDFHEGHLVPSSVDFEVSSALAGIPDWMQIAFMTFCCERMFPNFLNFNSESGHGNPQFIRHVLDLTWEWIETNKFNGDLEQIRQMCEKQAPNTCDFSSRYTSSALDTTTVMSIILDAIERFDSKLPIEVAQLARDSIDLYIQEEIASRADGLEFETMIIDHPLMQIELKCQKDSATLLRTLDDDRVRIARILRAKWSNVKFGSLPNKIKSGSN